MDQPFRPAEHSDNYYERFAYFASQAGDFRAAEEAEKEFYRECVGEDDCIIDDDRA